MFFQPSAPPHSGHVHFCQAFDMTDTRVVNNVVFSFSTLQFILAGLMIVWWRWTFEEPNKDQARQAEQSNLVFKFKHVIGD